MATKSITTIAQEVIAGKWGSGDERKKRLQAAGYNYDAVQKEVNRLLVAGTSVEALAIEVINGLWGSGEYRKNALTKKGYNYDVIQKKVTEFAKTMQSRKQALKPWFDACKIQEQWSYNAIYDWNKWSPKNIAQSKYYGTCITYPSVVAMRCKLIQEGTYIASSGSPNDDLSTRNAFWNHSVSAMNSINSKYWRAIKYPNKTLKELINTGVVIPGDIIGMLDHTTLYAGKDSSGNLLFHNAGHAADIYGSKPGSNRPVLNQKRNDYGNKIVYGVFSVNTFGVITSCTGGTITPTNLYMAGQTVKITITPNQGKAVTSIKVDGKVIPNTKTYTINKIDANHKIEVICGTASNSIPTPTPTHTTPTKKSIDVVAKEVIAGKWGSGDARKQKLKAAGYDYGAVQKKVNELLTPKKKSIDVIAQEVIDGKWGSGDTRKKKLIAAGYNYDAVQKRVNELLAKKASVKKTYSGKLPTIVLKKTNAEVIRDTVKWAKWIAADNSFHYGYTNKHGSSNPAKWNPNAHHNGCYFCGTNTTSGGRSKKGIVDYKKTYCCNPFVGAAWAHGGCVPKALSLCQKGGSWGFSKNSGYNTSKLFTNLGHPKKSSLKPGDVLCRNTHVALYVGNGKIAEAGSGDDNVRNSSKWNNSIHVITLTDKNYSNFPRVHRFNGSVNTTMTMRHGEVSDRIKLWQAFLNWYNGKNVCKIDGCFGDSTLKYTKVFQEKELGKGQGDGLIGPKTLAAAAKCKK